jgi:hypothetical protein
LDLNSVEVCVLEKSSRPPYIVNWGGEDWIRMNYDSGAATTAVPTELADESGLKVQGHFKVASGEMIEDFGRAKMKSEDERGLVRGITGHLTSVHKPLVSAAELASKQDAFITDRGGVLLPKDGIIAKELRKTLSRLLWEHGRDGVVDLHREGNLYNFYLKAGKWEPLDSVSSVSAQSQSGRSGFARPASRL